MSYPRSWGEALARFAYLLGGTRWEYEAATWAEDAVRAAYDGRYLSELDPAARAVAFNRFSAVVLSLETEEGDLAFSTDTRATIRAAFARQWGGMYLEGPPWSVDASELEARPSHDEWLHRADFGGVT